MRKDNYGDIYLLEMCWERQTAGLAVSSPTCCQKYVKRSPVALGRAGSQVLLTGGGPGARSRRPGGCPGALTLDSRST